MKLDSFSSLSLLLSILSCVEGFVVVRSRSAGTCSSTRERRGAAVISYPIIQLSSSIPNDPFFPSPTSHAHMLDYQRAVEAEAAETERRQNHRKEEEESGVHFHVPRPPSPYYQVPPAVMDEAESYSFRSLDEEGAAFHERPMPVALPILAVVNAAMLAMLISFASSSGAATTAAEINANLVAPQIQQRIPDQTVTTTRIEVEESTHPQTQEPSASTTRIDPDPTWSMDGSAGFYFY